MSVPKGHWMQCTPGFLKQWPNACGSTVRRPILEPCDDLADSLGKPPVQFMMVGHEHLLVRVDGEVRPLEHESGEPA